MLQILNILRSWGISISPNSKQAELAARRLEICGRCPYKMGKAIVTCSKCGCVISKKVFTPVKGTCPMQKWDKVEEEFFNKTKL